MPLIRLSEITDHALSLMDLTPESVDLTPLDNLPLFSALRIFDAWRVHSYSVHELIYWHWISKSCLSKYTISVIEWLQQLQPYFLSSAIIPTSPSGNGPDFAIWWHHLVRTFIITFLRCRGFLPKVNLHVYILLPERSEVSPKSCLGENINKNCNKMICRWFKFWPNFPKVGA